MGGGCLLVSLPSALAQHLLPNGMKGLRDFSGVYQGFSASFCVCCRLLGAEILNKPTGCLGKLKSPDF